MPADASAKVAIASFVPSTKLQEYLLLRRSFELLIGTADVQWIADCDSSCLPLLSRIPNTDAAVISGSFHLRSEPLSIDWARIVLGAIERAWNSGASRVIFATPDVVFLRPFFESYFGADVAIAGQKRMLGSMTLDAYPSPFTTPLISLKSRKFHHWWNRLVTNMDDISPDAFEFFYREFNPVLTDDYRECQPYEMLAANSTFVDFRRQNYAFVRVPLFERSDCRFEAVRRTFLMELGMYTGSGAFKAFFTAEELLNKAFAIQLVRHLKNSSHPQHRELAAEILTQDSCGLYRVAISSREQAVA